MLRLFSMTVTENIQKYGKRSEFHIHWAPHHSHYYLFPDVNLRVLTKLEELTQSQTVILDDLARVKAVLLLIEPSCLKMTMPSCSGPRFSMKKTDFYNRILQQSWRLICILKNFCKNTIFFHYFSNSIFMLALKHQSNFGCSLLTSHSRNPFALHMQVSHAWSLLEFIFDLSMNSLIGNFFLWCDTQFWKYPYHEYVYFIHVFH